MIGFTFPVLDHDEIKSVPWSLIEPHRPRMIRNHGQTPERLAARGGLSLTELAACILDRDIGDKGSWPTDAEARRVVGLPPIEKVKKEKADAKD